MIEISEASLWLLLLIAFCAGYLAGGPGARQRRGRGWRPKQPTKRPHTWETTGEGATRVADGAELVKRRADLFAWVQKTFGRGRV